MGYKVLGPSENICRGFGPRRGLEGPFPTLSGKVLYYDVKEGKYYDPTSDFYLEHDEAFVYLNETFEALKK